MRLTLTLFSLFACLTFGALAQSWQPLGSGLNGQVKAIAVYNNKIYAGGVFTVGSSHVAVFDENTQSWSSAGNGLNADVFALTVHAGKLYAGGNFNLNGAGTSCPFIATLNTSTNVWEPVLGGTTALVRAIYSDGTDLYIGGSFGNTGPATYIAKYSASGWVNMGNPGGFVNAISKFNGNLYIAGSTQMGMLAVMGANNTWTKLGTGSLNGAEASSLAVFGNYIYVAGPFNGAYGSGVVRYNGSSLVTGFTPLNGFAYALYATPARLLGGGAFTASTNGTQLPHIFTYNGNAPYATFGTGFNGNIYSFGNQNGYILAGGTFTLANGVTVNNICRSTTTIDVQEIESVVLESTVYPNPMIQQATLSFKTREYLQAPSLQILDATGRCVKSFPEPTSNQGLSVDYIFNRESLATGTYFYFLSEGESQIASGKLIVQ